MVNHRRFAFRMQSGWRRKHASWKQRNYLRARQPKHGIVVQESDGTGGTNEATEQIGMIGQVAELLGMQGIVKL